MLSMQNQQSAAHSASSSPRYTDSPALRHPICGEARRNTQLFSITDDEECKEQAPVTINQEEEEEDEGEDIIQSINSLLNKGKLISAY